MLLGKPITSEVMSTAGNVAKGGGPAKSTVGARY